MADNGRGVLNGCLKKLLPWGVVVATVAVGWGTLRGNVKYNAESIVECKENWRELRPQLREINDSLVRILAILEGH
jgi:hypothetical protein